MFPSIDSSDPLRKAIYPKRPPFVEIVLFFTNVKVAYHGIAGGYKADGTDKCSGHVLERGRFQTCINCGSLARKSLEIDFVTYT